MSPLVRSSTAATLTQESSTKDAHWFGVMQSDAGMNYWKRWYLIENDGAIGYNAHWEHPSRYSGLAAAAKQGLAAGKIWIDGSHARTVEGRPLVMSGFCLDHYHFITAAHYLMDASPQERTDSIANMQNPNVQGIAISINRTSMQMLKYIQDTSVRYAYLIREDRVHDVAVFRIKHDEQEWEHAVQPSQLAPAAEHIWSYTFSVGYARDCQGQEEERIYDTFWQSMQTALQGSRHSSLRLGFENLVAKQAGKPVFQDLFCPNRRAIAFGYILATESGPEALTQNNGGYWHHDVPGWFGLSGSMMGILVGAGLEVQIIGLFKGAEYNDIHNRLVAFTPEIIDWIHSTIGYIAQGTGKGCDQ
ncbi:MAG: hypothetical protein LQ343_007801 [Gyalolechia ehrenbergii]|nr:MAG: hypothetical protein LQ343_007801 [Gyalolechia ehrenbergii]